LVFSPVAWLEAVILPVQFLHREAVAVVLLGLRALAAMAEVTVPIPAMLPIPARQRQLPTRELVAAVVPSAQKMCSFLRVALVPQVACACSSC
jgi:hypothetical protein